jgi:hypothetical protein
MKTEKLKALLHKDTKTIELPGGQRIDVSTLPPTLQIAVATLDEWRAQHAELLLEHTKLERAIKSMEDSLQGTLIALNPAPKATPPHHD